jgi:hypothetical protein
MGIRVNMVDNLAGQIRSDAGELDEAARHVPIDLIA